MSIRFVMTASTHGPGWRIWNRNMKMFWGETFPRQPDELVAELNGLKRPEVLVALRKSAMKK